MPTSANIWEIGGREIPRPSELDAGKRDGLNLGEVGGLQRPGYVEETPPLIVAGGQGARRNERNTDDRGGGEVGMAL